MDPKTIGRFIAQCRTEQNLTQARLAERLGVSDRSVSRWENGKTMPDLSLYEPLCRELNIEVSELLYARRMTSDEKTVQGEVSAQHLLATKSQLETTGVFTEILIFVGILMTITFPKLVAEGTAGMILSFVCGCFVWGFGLVLRVRLRRALQKLEQDPNAK